MSETIDSIIKAATDEIRDYFLKGIADGMADNTRNMYPNRIGEAYNLGFDIGKDADRQRRSKTTAPPTPPAKADEWPKVWMDHEASTIWFKMGKDEPMLIVGLRLSSDVEKSIHCEADMHDVIRLIPEARP